MNPWLLNHLGTWLANVWTTGSEDIPFPAAWDRLKDPAFWRRHLTIALADQARHGLGTVHDKNMKGTGSFVTALQKGARLRGLVKYQFGAPKGHMFSISLYGVEIFMLVRVLLRGLPRLPDAPAARVGLRDKVKAGVSLCLDGKAVFPVARIPADALPFTKAAWQCNLLPQRAIFSHRSRSVQNPAACVYRECRNQWQQ